MLFFFLLCRPANHTERIVRLIFCVEILNSLIINFYVSAFDASLSSKNLFNATSEISDKWYTLGVQLDIKSHNLRSIESHGTFSVDKCRHEMFDVWIQSDPNASWEKLVEALNTMDYHCLAQSVQTKYADVYNQKNEQGIC